MLTIWKYTLQPECDVQVPVASKVLSVHEQHGDVNLWALVDPSNELITRHFSVYGTGHEVPAHPGEFIGTVHIHGGALVFHVFERKG